ncbi:hypothetical protein SNEBB_000767 [Seison nebaliae]|nr:hypothetical protein SNEBB_000767 [Seison nebaliae]
MSLPFLPGNAIPCHKGKTTLKQSLNYRNGYRVCFPARFDKDGNPIQDIKLTEQEMADLADLQTNLTYGEKRTKSTKIIPRYEALANKVLRFFGYFKQTILESPEEYYRVRPVTLYYYLEDDTMQMNEKNVENSGINQGKFLKRHQFLKNENNDTYSWKDLNISMNLPIYGRVFRISDCDPFTKEWLTSEGIIVNEPELIPNDPYMEKRTHAANVKTFQTPNDYDSYKQFLEMDRKVLRFLALWDDRDSMFGEVRPYLIQYYLVNDTIEIREIHEINDGREPFPLLVNRHKIPINRDAIYDIFPPTEPVTKKLYFTPEDFRVGGTVIIYGRKFILYDCDAFTKDYYRQNFGVTDFSSPTLNIPNFKAENLPKMEIAPYEGYGDIADSVQSSLKLVPEPPKKDLIKLIENQHNHLRYEAVLDSVYEVDKGRRFVISYNLSNDTISIYEPPVANSGFTTGKVLLPSRITKPGSDPNNAEFYGPKDLYPGATVTMFKRRYVIFNADLHVLKYAEEHQDQFGEKALTALRQKLGTELMVENQKDENHIVKRELPNLSDNDILEEVRNKLKSCRITGAEKMRSLFLQINNDRTGYISKDNMKAFFHKLNLPMDEALLDKIMKECSTDGKVDLQKFSEFFNE